MNLKPNLWTLLFVLAAVAAVYPYLQPTTPNEGTEPTTDTPPALNYPHPELLGAVEDWYENEITFATFDSRYTDYKATVAAVLQSDEACSGMALYFNRDMRYVMGHALAETEIEQMYHLLNPDGEDTNPNQRVFAYPVTEIREGVRYHDLVFLVELEDGKHRYFDFTEPCPPVCEKVPFHY